MFLDIYLDIDDYVHDEVLLSQKNCGTKINCYFKVKDIPCGIHIWLTAIHWKNNILKSDDSDDAIILFVGLRNGETSAAVYASATVRQVNMIL